MLKHEMKLPKTGVLTWKPLGFLVEFKSLKLTDAADSGNIECNIVVYIKVGVRLITGDAFVTGDGILGEIMWRYKTEK